MCGWMGNGRRARVPAPATIFRTLLAVMGPPRSDTKRYAPSGQSRRSCRKARSFWSPQGMRGRHALLQALHVEEAGFQVHLVPAQADRFTDSQAVPKHQQEECTVADAMPAPLACRAEEALDLIGGEILSTA
jgi:hypothetical protein